ncbi:MAG: hypothetical protein A2Y67_01945 [Candidatus Buchananbacteria bacterium RBG_13_39_9]|uniref:Phosphoribosyltransferase domain-containing protein n=1 Tax=Candidatus Buchananbacteria bacterium RBG_13_39_9 TaxID=1797531 RepID=A0A1G1XPW6_9BACT|nr:MAG: hypothetical protein A2Y67_01945 [Candidatus Buchananbacteria bacterium RBG_13_39_9]
MRKKIKIAADFILNLIFPKECLGCQKEGCYLCQNCLAKIELNDKFYCALCKKPSPLMLICSDCRKSSELKAIWVAADYNNALLQDLIHLLKYNYVEEISGILGDLAIKYLQTNQILGQFNLNSANTIIVPVPLHKKRWQKRGFNQSELLADLLSSRLGLAKENLIGRIKNTQTQINLKRNERQENVKSAFSLKNIALFDKNKKIILIDDVVTTGSTLNECAKVLEQAGFMEIYGLVVAQRED